jgi:dTDP-L-rhamnose 4-epimerase
VVTELLKCGDDVRVLDSLVPQVHGHGPARGLPWDGEVEFRVGDVSVPGAAWSAVEGCEAVVHLAAEVGVGQSMYEPARYVRANVLGTAALLEAVARHRPGRLVIAGSMSSYGEGVGRCEDCGLVRNGRAIDDLLQSDFAVHCPECDEPTTPEPTDEEQALMPTSVYALTKRDQEEYALLMGAALDIPTVVLRFFNIYGAGQSPTNPYTGVLVNFITRVRHGLAPLVYEDGGQGRDFVHVSDVAWAVREALTRFEPVGTAVNVGTGRVTTVLELARAVCDRLDPGQVPELSGRYRVGDVRHCVADATRLSSDLGVVPRVGLADGGLDAVIDWYVSQPLPEAPAWQEAEHALRRHRLIW